MDVLKKFQEATADSAPCDLFDDLSPIAVALNRLVVWMTNTIKRHFK